MTRTQIIEQHIYPYTVYFEMFIYFAIGFSTPVLYRADFRRIAHAHSRFRAQKHENVPLLPGFEPEIYIMIAATLAATSPPTGTQWL